MMQSATTPVNPTAQQVEQWIQIASDGRNSNEQRTANLMLHQWLEQTHQKKEPLKANDNVSNNDSSVINILLQLVVSTNIELVLFYSLTTLSRLQLSAIQEKYLRDYLLQKFPYNPQLCNLSKIHVVNKVSSILVQQMVRCVGNTNNTNSLIPDGCSWSTMWEEVFQLLHLGSALLFLKIFSCLLDDLQTNNDQHHDRGNLKQMKQCFYDETLSNKLLENTIQIYNQSSSILLQSLQQSLQGQRQQEQMAQEQQKQQQQLAVLSLSVIKSFLVTYYLSNNQYHPVLQTLLSSLQHGVVGKQLIQQEACTNHDPITITIPICSTGIQCLQEFILGPAPFTEKQPILIPILEAIENYQLLEEKDSSNPLLFMNQESVPVRVGKLMNVIGIQLLSFLSIAPPVQKQQQNIQAVWNPVKQFFLLCLAHDDMDVAANVLPFLNDWINHTSQQEELSKKKNVNKNDCGSHDCFSLFQHINTILQHLFQQMKYPDDYDDTPICDIEHVDDGYNDCDDIMAEEELIRSEMCKVYIKLVRLSPNMCLQFLVDFVHKEPYQSQQQQLVKSQVFWWSLPNVSWQDVEAFLRLVYHYCEGIRPPPGMKVVMKNDTFIQLLINIQSTASTAMGTTTTLIQQYSKHRHVALLYFQTVVRYYPLLKANSRLLQELLFNITGQYGLQHPNDSLVRSRCCYLLLRIIKSILSISATPGSSNHILQPFIETAINGIQGLLLSSQQQQQQTVSTNIDKNTQPINSQQVQYNHQLLLRQDDTLYLFETIGLLVGKTNISIQDQHRFLNQIMTPHIQLIHAVLNAIAAPNIGVGVGNGENSILDDDEDENVQILANSIAAIAHVSKGYPNNQPPDESIQNVIFVETVNVALLVLRTIPFSETIRSKTCIFLQRMIHCITHKIMQPLPTFLYYLIQYCSTHDEIMDISQLIVQTTAKFRSKSLFALDASLLPFLQKCQFLIQQLVKEETLSSDSQPHIQTEKLCIQKVAYNVLQHLVSNEVTEILFSTTNVSNMEMFLRTMYDGAINVEDAVVKKTCLRFFRELLNSMTIIHEGVFNFTGQIFIPGILNYMSLPTFNQNDAIQTRNVKEFAHLLFIYKKLQTQLGSAPAGSYYEQFVIGTLSTSSNNVAIPTNILDAFRSANTIQEINLCLREWMKEVKSHKNKV